MRRPDRSQLVTPWARRDPVSPLTPSDRLPLQNQHAPLPRLQTVKMTRPMDDDERGEQSRVARVLASSRRLRGTQSRAVVKLPIAAAAAAGMAFTSRTVRRTRPRAAVHVSAPSLASPEACTDRTEPGRVTSAFHLHLHLRLDPDGVREPVRTHNLGDVRRRTPRKKASDRTRPRRPPSPRTRPRREARTRAPPPQRPCPKTESTSTCPSAASRRET